MDRPKPKAKPFAISKWVVVDAYERVKANAGPAGIDGESIAAFEANLKGNLYKLWLCRVEDYVERSGRSQWKGGERSRKLGITTVRPSSVELWNQMSSESYFAGPVRAVEIPKDHGAGVRTLGVANTVDRVAQTAIAMLLEEKLEPIFHTDSYGYRPGRSAHDALAVTRKRCWEQDWVLDLDVRAFIDSVPHDLLLNAVAHLTEERWVLLYIERWLRAPRQMPDGTLLARGKGTPQGSPISPLPANLFMHYAFDRWMVREHPACPFERYADDIVAHCDTEEQAHSLRPSIAERLGPLDLELHPDKTRIVFWKDANRPGEAEHTSFDFLGYTFRGRQSRGPKGSS